ncbi:MAG: matrixin family metalloprotease [Blastococcus sp.]
MDVDGTDSDERSLPTSPTGRIPQWVLDDAFHSTAPPLLPAPLRRRRRTGGRALGVVVLVLVLVLGGGVLLGPHLWPWTVVGDPATVLPGDTAPPGGPPAVPTGQPQALGDQDQPTPGHEAARAPRGHPLPPPPGGGPYTFISTQTDGVTPVAYDPCRPVHYVIRPDGAPAGGEEAITAAVARVSEVTGLQFVHDGGTDEPTTLDREIFQPDRYGDRWAPVLIAWESDVQNPALAGEIVGEGGSTAVSLGDGPQVLVTGTVSLDAGQFPQILDRRHGMAIARAVILHELGHLVGLGHVEDDQQLMYPQTHGDVLDFAAGDLTGLAALGSGRCVPAL